MSLLTRQTSSFSFLRRWTCRRLPFVHSSVSTRWQSSQQPLSSLEADVLNQELPPRDEYEAEKEVNIPGDSYGILRNRVPFYYPIPRTVYGGPLGDLMPAETPQAECYNAGTIQYLAARFNAGVETVLRSLQEARGDINVAVQLLEQRCGGPCMQFGAYGLVCMESYAPETFCLVSFSLPTFESTRDDAVLDVLHELTLSAAEIPLDVPRRELVDRLTNHWTTDDGTPCRDLLEEYNITVNHIVLLPHGDYGAQGFFVLHPVKESTPNIGTAVGATCIDLRTGIHNRFRFHVERIADSLSEHVVEEMVHYNQGVHILRQPYWLRPEYSVEEYIRFKESLLQPSALTLELRYSFLFAQMYNLPTHSNVVEMEKLKIAQYKLEKHYEDSSGPGSFLTSDKKELQTVSSGAGAMTPGGAMTYDQHSAGKKKRPSSAGEELRRHGDRALERFYRNNYF